MIYGYMMPTTKDPVNLHRFKRMLTTGDIGRLGKTSEEVAEDVASWLIPITSFMIDFLLSDGPIRGNNNAKKKYKTVLEHDSEVLAMLRLPHFAKYAMHSLQLKLYLDAEFDPEFETEFGEEEDDFPEEMHLTMIYPNLEIEWVIGDDVINPTERCFARLVNDGYMSSVYKTGKEGIENGFGPAIVENLEDQVLVLLGPTVLKVRDGFVSSIAKRFSSQVIKQKQVPISKRMMVGASW